VIRTIVYHTRNDSEHEARGRRCFLKESDASIAQRVKQRVNVVRIVVGITYINGPSATIEIRYELS
jgi:hypothetical protein